MDACGSGARGQRSALRRSRERVRGVTAARGGLGEYQLPGSEVTLQPACESSLSGWWWWWLCPRGAGGRAERAHPGKRRAAASR